MIKQGEEDSHKPKCVETDKLKEAQVFEFIGSYHLIPFPPDTTYLHPAKGSGSQRTDGKWYIVEEVRGGYVVAREMPNKTYDPDFGQQITFAVFKFHGPHYYEIPKVNVFKTMRKTFID